MAILFIILLVAAIAIWQYAKKREARAIKSAILHSTLALNQEVDRARTSLGSRFDSLSRSANAMAYTTGFIIAM